MSSFSWPNSGGSGVTTYANYAALPLTGTHGDLAITLDTNYLYEFDGASWVVIAGPGSVLTVGTFDSGTAASNGAHIDSSSLIMQSASSSKPGLVNTGTQTLAGTKTFSSGIVASGGVDAAATLNLGTSTASTVNIGRSGSTINIIGSTIYEQVTNLQVTDKLITVNKDGGATTGFGAGIELEENAIITGYAKTSVDRNSWQFLAPNTSGVATITPGSGGITLDQSSHNPVTLGAFGSTPNSNGLSLSTQVLTLQPADGTNPGAVSTTTQTFGGSKTFNRGLFVFGTADENQLTLQGNSTQTNPIFQVISSAFSSLLTLSNGGNLFAAGNISATSYVSGNYFTGASANPATVGDYRLANTATVSWRNSTNSANLGLSLNASNLFAFDAGLTTSGTATVGQLIDSGLTASTVPYADVNKQLTSSSVTPTELGYVSGVTSAIQTQINTKITGPSSATDNALTRYDGTTGKLAQNTSVTVDDNGLMALTDGSTLYGRLGGPASFPTTPDGSAELFTITVPSQSGVSGIAVITPSKINGDQTQEITFQSGNTSGGTGSSGAIYGRTGTASADGNTGSIVWFSGNTSGDLSYSGAVGMVSGDITSGAGISGDVIFRTGAATGGTRGAITLDGRQVDVSSVKIVNLATPTSSTDAANKSYVDGLVPLTTLGDILYENATPAPTRLAGNTTATKKFLTQTGNGSISAAPGWNTIVAGDVPAINLAAGGNGGVTGTLPTGNGGTGVAAVTTSPTASSFAGWDANKNLSANSFIDGYRTTATAAGTTTLVVGDAKTQYFTGSTTQTVKMPVTSTLVTGQQFRIVNLSSGVVTAQSSGANTIQAMATNSQLILTCISTSGTGTSSWDWTYTNIEAGLALTNPMNTSGDIIYGDTGGTPTRLAANSTATKKYLQSVSSGVPSYAQVAFSDLSGTATSSQVVTATFTAPTIQTFTSGSGTYTTPTSPRSPLYIRVRMVGGGGGGAGSSTAAANDGGAGGAGGNSTFGSSLLVANGGSGGTINGGGASGGTASLGTGPVGTALSGGKGEGPGSGGATVFPDGGAGASGPFGGGSGTGPGQTGGAGATNTGSGGAGGGANSATTSYGGAGGGAGGFVDALITSSISATYSYAVGAAGTAGTAGTSGLAGGAGGSGYIEVTEYYQ